MAASGIIDRKRKVLDCSLFKRKHARKYCIICQINDGILNYRDNYEVKSEKLWKNGSYSVNSLV